MTLLYCLPWHPTSQVEKDLNKMLAEIKETPADHDQDKHQIEHNLYFHLHSTDATSATFYGLPKVHKPSVLYNPSIASFSQGDDWGRVSHLPTTCQDTWFASSLLFSTRNILLETAPLSPSRDQRVSEDDVLVSFDVISLLTSIPGSIPVDLALEVTKQRMQQDTNLSQRTNISVTNIMKTNKSLDAPANLVMEYVEETAISTAPHPPRWWFRYVDDSHACLYKQHVQEFHDHINSINQHTCIRFTIEIEGNNRLPFLDTLTIERTDMS